MQQMAGHDFPYSSLLPRDERSLGEVHRSGGHEADRLAAVAMHCGYRPGWSNLGASRPDAVEQAERLLKLSLLDGAGYKMEALTGLSDTVLDELLARHGIDLPLTPMLDAAMTLEFGPISRLLKVRLASQGIEDWIFRTVLPLLCEVGVRWSEERLPVAGERVASLAVGQALLAELERGAAETRVSNPGPVTPGEAPDAGRPRALAATLTGDPHEFGAMIAAVLAGHHGCQTRYIGGNLPAWEVAGAASRFGARYVLVSSLTPNRTEAERQLRRLSAALSDDCILVAGGCNLDALADLPNLRRLEDLHDLGAIFC
jgi:methylmalonyl-CoA mutase cobalamin-binding subunit